MSAGLKEQALAASLLVFVKNIMDPLLCGFPADSPGIALAVSPSSPDRGRLTIDRKGRRMVVEFWADGWAPMRPATATLLTQAGSVAYMHLACTDPEFYSEFDSEKVEKLANGFFKHLVKHHSNWPVWNELPRDGWLEIEYWFEKSVSAA